MATKKAKKTAKKSPKPRAKAEKISKEQIDQLNAERIEEVIKSVTSQIVESVTSQPPAINVPGQPTLSDKMRVLYKLGTQQVGVMTGAGLKAKIQSQYPELIINDQRANREQIAFIISDGTESFRCPSAGFFTVDG